jgi:hypothetical protein
MEKRPRDVEEQPDYHAYLLRMWRENAGRQTWRASLESAQSGLRKGFASLNELFRFLERTADLEPNEKRESRVGRERRR